jgi:lipid A 4'-phosphatase
MPLPPAPQPYKRILTTHNLWRRVLRLDLLAFFACALLFSVAPALDLQVSGWFYQAGLGFVWTAHPWVQLPYTIFKSQHILWLVLALLLYWLLLKIASKRKPLDTTTQAFRHQQVAYLLVLILVGPVLFVNAGLKDHWGRARPIQVTQFGGEKSFTPALVPAQENFNNASFVSGHAAGAFSLIGLYFITRRKRWMLAGIALGAWVGVGRIIQGGHFLSDVVFAFWAVYACAALLARLMPLPRPDQTE